MITVVARYRAETGRGNEVAEALAGHVVTTRAEPGCISFVALRATDDPDRFVLYEQYVDEAAFQAHRDSGHFRTNITNRVAPLLAERTWDRYHVVG